MKWDAIIYSIFNWINHYIVLCIFTKYKRFNRFYILFFIILLWKWIFCAIVAPLMFFFFFNCRRLLVTFSVLLKLLTSVENVRRYHFIGAMEAKSFSLETRKLMKSKSFIFTHCLWWYYLPRWAIPKFTPKHNFPISSKFHFDSTYWLDFVKR